MAVKQITKNSKAPGGVRIKVLLVDDHPMVREGMRRLMEGEGGFEVVGEVDSVEGALEELKRKKVEELFRSCSSCSMT